MMTPLLVTVGVTGLAAAVETMIRCFRLHHLAGWSRRSALTGAIFWAIALVIFQLNRTMVGVPTVVLNSIVGGVVWYAVSLLLGHGLWRLTSGTAKRQR
jgi:hypothetical protein